jgi:hypothetical protein
MVPLVVDGHIVEREIQKTELSLNRDKPLRVWAKGLPPSCRLFFVAASVGIGDFAASPN